MSQFRDTSRNPLAARLNSYAAVVGLELVLSSQGDDWSGDRGVPTNGVTFRVAGFNRSVADAGWSQFRQILQWQATKAAKVIVVFSAKDTTQRCSRCGEKANPRMELSDRVFRCRACGLVLGRDRNAARNQNPDPDRPRPGGGTEPPGTDPVGADGTKSKMPVGAEAA
jgi:transposase